MATKSKQLIQNATPPVKPKTGRPLLKIDPEEVEKLAGFGCTIEEMAAFFECSRDTLEIRFSAIIAKGRQCGKMRLRKMQINIVEAGSAAMAIFLGKNCLGQSDKIEASFEDKSLGYEQEKAIADKFINSIKLANAIS